jgi:uncharacterized membrane protein affecting hemolysin expression
MQCVPIFLAQIETSEKVVKGLTDQVYNQPVNWFVCAGLIGSLAFIGVLLTRTFRQADRTAQERNELQEVLLKMNRESVEALTQIKSVVSDVKLLVSDLRANMSADGEKLRSLMSADVEATRVLADKIGEQNGEIKVIAKEILRGRRQP